MCGIAGIYNKNEIALDHGIIKAMSDALAHRGPDAEGFHFDRHVHLASRRLSIIDLDAGSQPVYNNAKTCCIVFNGEIYNHASLRDELASLGHTFRTRTDTEVVVNAYCEWGEQCLSRFKGMFAFAIWDSIKKELFLARDRFGIKPLYYSELQDGTFLFGSEIKALLQHPRLERRVYVNAIDNLLTFGFNTAPHTFFEGIKQLLPAHFMRVGPKGVSFKEYWDIDLDAPMLEGTIDEITEELRARFKEAVKIGVISDVPVATYLSGGIDSTAITGMYSRLSGQKITTLTITFENAGYDEREYSRKAAEFYDTRYNEFECSIEPDEIKNLVYHLENPVVSLLNLPFFLLAKEAKGLGIKVVLTGDGADEILGGYDYFKLVKAMAFIEKTGSACRENVLKRIYPHLRAPYETETMYLHLRLLSNRFPAMHPALPYQFQEFQPKHKLYSREFAQSLKANPATNPFYFDVGKTAHRSILDQALYIEAKMRLLNLTLLLADKMSMANSVEVRPLFLDHEFVDFLFRIPPCFKMLGLSESSPFSRRRDGLSRRQVICYRSV
jgi:asparagine synthase (glutamine-hydrolysing)